MTDALPDLDPAAREGLRADARLLQRTAGQLSRPHLIRRVVVLVLGLAVFWVLASLILGFGRSVNYSALGPPDAAAVSLLTRINVYIWWAVVAVLAVITLIWLRAAWSSSVERENAVAIPAEVMRAMAPQVSPHCLGVMRWVWADQSEPFALGDLRRTVSELRSGRVEKMLAVREQQQLLQMPVPTVHEVVAEAMSGQVLEPVQPWAAALRTPVMSEGGEPAMRAAGRDEPFLGSERRG